MNIQFDFDYPKQFPWLRPMIDAEFGKTLERAAAGQLAAFGKAYVLEDAIASGDTFKSFQISDVMNFGDRKQIEIAPRGDRAQIVSWLEFGRPENRSRKPSPEMIANIRQWIIDKGIASEGEDDGKLLHTLSWAISQTIAREGIEPRHILEKSERRYRPQIIKMFEAATRRLAKKINSKISISHN